MCAKFVEFWLVRETFCNWRKFGLNNRIRIKEAWIRSNECGSMNDISDG